jgi:hypothetical protein
VEITRWFASTRTVLAAKVFSRRTRNMASIDATTQASAARTTGIGTEDHRRR